VSVSVVVGVCGWRPARERSSKQLEYQQNDRECYPDLKRVDVVLQDERERTREERGEASLQATDCSGAGLWQGRGHLAGVSASERLGVTSNDFC
jgi:hypothetical protein